ncbi:LCP family protein [Streptomyces sp. NPDC059680]|uniref:LCP family protein n=1 Tax=Streptomyces sp. NPDC059680 TaxID=3346904 RepID=UPI0036B94DBE
MTVTGDHARSSRHQQARSTRHQHEGGPPRQRSSQGGRTAQRRAHNPVRRALLLALSLVILCVAGVGWTLLRLSSNIGTFDTSGLSSDRPTAVPATGENILIIGSDARTDGNNMLGGGNADDSGRSDTTFLLHIHADRRHATAVSIPRDTLVTVPPCRLPDGTWTKSQANALFNSAFSVGQTKDGNPACTQNTVEHLTGLHVDHTVVLDFKGFAALTDAVGGVRVCLPKNVYQNDLDPNRSSRGKLLFKKGAQTVSGEQALRYVRIRHGIGDSSDMGRIKRQQAFFASLVGKIRREGLTPARLLPLAEAATQSMTVDPGLGSANKLMSFVMSLKDMDLHDIEFVTIPWRYQGERVAIVQPDADQLWTALKADRTIDGKGTRGGTGRATPSKAAIGNGIDVAVYNGTAVSGLARSAATTLTQQGFTVTGIANADSQDHATTVIRYGRGLKAEARRVAGLFPGARLQTGDASGLNVILGRSSASPGAASSSVQAAVPSSVADDARAADDDLCSHLSYG